MNDDAVVALDASPLNHFARAGELDTLAVLLKTFRCVTTDLVEAELRQGVARHPEIQGALTLPWLNVVRLDGLEEMYAFASTCNGSDMCGGPPAKPRSSPGRRCTMRPCTSTISWPTTPLGNED